MFKIKLQCANCKGDSFKAYDTVNSKQSDVVGLAHKIAADGIINFSAFVTECTKCGNISDKLLSYTKGGKDEK